MVCVQLFSVDLLRKVHHLHNCDIVQAESAVSVQQDILVPDVFRFLYLVLHVKSCIVTHVSYGPA